MDKKIWFSKFTKVTEDELNKKFNEATTGEQPIIFNTENEPIRIVIDQCKELIYDYVYPDPIRMGDFTFLMNHDTLRFIDQSIFMNTRVDYSDNIKICELDVMAKDDIEPGVIILYDWFNRTKCGDPVYIKDIYKQFVNIHYGINRRF